MDRIKQANKVINQLTATGAKFEVLSSAEGKKVVRQFIDHFIASEKRERCHLNLSRPITAQKPIDYHNYFLPHHLRDINDVILKETLVRWLSRNTDWRCHLFFSEPWITPVMVDISTLKDSSLSVFPDSYWLNFRTRRLIVLTRDNETILCEMPESKR